MRRIKTYGLAGIVCVAASGCWLWPDGTTDQDAARPVGLIQLIEFHDIQGLRNWAYELEHRGIKSLAFIQKNMFEAYPAELRWLAAQGHEIAGRYAEQALWDVDYQTQLEIMRETKELAEQVTGKPMRVFGSKYLAYDENTLKAADFDEWVTPECGVNLQLPMSLIPINREVQYETPAPSEPLDDLEDVDQMHNPCGAP